jgi:hypothetical protein
MIRVVIDTNVAGGKVERALATTDLRRLIDETRRGNVQLVVPEIVVKEAANLWTEHVKEQVDSFATASRKLLAAGLLASSPPEVVFDRETVRAAEESRLRTLVVEAGGLVPSLPTRRHTDIVERALARKQPFDTKGRNGYRDVLLWETVVELAAFDSPIVFVARDKAAFFERADAARGLAQDLRREAAARCRGIENVELFFELADGLARSLELARQEAEIQKALEQQARADAAALVDLNNMLTQDEGFAELLADGVDEALRYWDVTSELDAFGVRDADAYEAAIDIVENIQHVTFTSAHVTENGEVLAEVEADVVASATLALHPSSATMLEDHPQVRIYDFGYGTHKAEGVVDISGHVVADVVVDPATRSLASLVTVSGLAPPTS